MRTQRSGPWEDAYQVRKEHTMEMIRQGKAGPEMMRQFGPGPWDHDPTFWSSPRLGDSDVVLDHEMEEDIVFEDM